MKKIQFLLAITLFLPSSYTFSADYQKGLDCFNKEDFECALAEWRPLADQGNASAQYKLGYLYVWGDKHDFSKAAGWYRLAAEQGFVKAQSELGLWYDKGYGVKRDYSEAIKWYRLAADQGDERSQTNLDILEDKVACEKKSKIQLFEEYLLCTSRYEMRTAIKKAGATPTREETNNFADLYDSRKVLAESKTLTIYYLNDEVAKAEYVFPSNLDSNQVVRIKNMVASKYGDPSSSSGNISLGDASFTWQFQDGVEILVSRGWPNTTTYMSLIVPSVNKKMLARIDEIKAEKKKKEYAAQSNAF